MMMMTIIILLIIATTTLIISIILIKIIRMITTVIITITLYLYPKSLQPNQYDRHHVYNYNITTATRAINNARPE